MVVIYLPNKICFSNFRVGHVWVAIFLGRQDTSQTQLLIQH